ncbi:Oidioi.mRNA.OKI2018_I69.chr2.g7220.t1.cds [Oikopleura dioica]|uniref:Oidioi.mRNA.OKI2018_I69.chr2.g7220.t1.cds n=1 Tax=Oikopleura dioica TaxID=34765 RepID=A0ABN7TC64_OIKDI|nr:Oidioi.mRNA.OKI2018_I69.chr2.g7220.t1.cds [Oikopleura dioica]
MRLERGAGDFFEDIRDGAKGIIDDISDGFGSVFDCIGASFQANKDFDLMLWAAYVMLIAPILSFLVNGMMNQKQKTNDTDKKGAGSIGFAGLISIISGAIYLAFYYKVKNCDFGTFGKCFEYDLLKWHVGLSMFLLVLGAMIAVMLTLAALGQVCCGDEKLTSMCVYIFLMIQMGLTFAPAIVSVSAGWKYTFGKCAP